MIEEPPLLRVNTQRRRPTQEQIEALRGTPTAFLCDAMEGRGALTPEISALSPAVLGSELCGPALTCLCGPADLLAALGALTEVQAGDIVVAATGSWEQTATVGDRYMGMLKNSQARGLVTDGRVRDLEGIEAVGVPVFCTGLSPNSPFTSGPGEIGFAVHLGGVTVSSGDMIIGDSNGVVVVPFERIDEVIKTLESIKKLEAELDAQVADGLIVPEAISELMQSDRVKRV